MLSSCYIFFSFVIAVTPRNTTLTSDRPNHVGALGHPITITCSAEGVPDIYYGIYRDGNLISNSTNLTFTIPSLALSDEGQYSCIPKNILGAGPTKDFNLTVHGKCFRAFNIIASDLCLHKGALPSSGVEPFYLLTPQF